MIMICTNLNLWVFFYHPDGDEHRLLEIEIAISAIGL